MSGSDRSRHPRESVLLLFLSFGSDHLPGPKFAASGPRGPGSATGPRSRIWLDYILATGPDGGLSGFSLDDLRETLTPAARLGSGREPAGARRVPSASPPRRTRSKAVARARRPDPVVPGNTS